MGAQLLSAAVARERFGEALALSDELIQELDEADALWISTPVYNFTVPATLKNWIGLVVRRDVTFTTTESVKVGCCATARRSERSHPAAPYSVSRPFSLTFFARP